MRVPTSVQYLVLIHLAATGEGNVLTSFEESEGTAYSIVKRSRLDFLCGCEWEESDFFTLLFIFSNRYQTVSFFGF